MKRNRVWKGYLIVLGVFLAIALLLNGTTLGAGGKRSKYDRYGYYRYESRSEKGAKRAAAEKK